MDYEWGKGKKLSGISQQVRDDDIKEKVMDVEIRKNAWNLDIFWRINRVVWGIKYEVLGNNREWLLQFWLEQLGEYWCHLWKQRKISEWEHYKSKFQGQTH